MASGHMVKLMLHCALAAYINPLAVALKDLWSDCKNTWMQIGKKKQKTEKSKNAGCLFPPSSLSTIMEALSDPA